ncbi:MAG: cytochrome c biogenesis CcdA family protein, partial [bacterium]
MIDAPLALGFAAGMVAAFNPCGFAMLPAYVSWFLGLETNEGQQPAQAGVFRSLAVGASVSVGVVLV